MSTKVAEIISIIDRDDAAAWVTHLWDKFNNQRREKIEEWNELRNYILRTQPLQATRASLGRTLPLYLSCVRLGITYTLITSQPSSLTRTGYSGKQSHEIVIR